MPDTKIDFDALPQIVGGEVKIRFEAGDDREFFFFFKPLQETVLRRYRTIYSGPPGSRKGKPEQAFAYLFGAVFLRTDGLELRKYLEADNGNAPAYTSEQDFWLKHPRAALWADAAIESYLGNQRPDPDDTKG